VATVAQLVVETERDIGATCPVGIGTPGAVSSRGLIKNANSTALIGKPLHADLEAAIGRSIRIANDADCLALSEATDGAAAGARVVFGAILGTGVGGGIVVDGALVAGPNAIAGEWGHNPLPWPQLGEIPGPRCYCGKRGCLETWLSGPGFAREASLERYVDRLARGLATIVNVLDPHVVVLGGGVSNVADLPELVSAALPKYAFTDVLATRIVRAAHGDSSGVRGAARLWPA